MKVLIIEDEKELADSIIQYLSSEQFVCEPAKDFNTALEKIHLNEYSCIVLDLTLPNGSGLDILRELKKQKKEDGVLIISARNSTDDKIEGLNLEADDYLAKPFHLAERGARVAAIIRRKSFRGQNKEPYLIGEGCTACRCYASVLDYLKNRRLRAGTYGGARGCRG